MPQQPHGDQARPDGKDFFAVPPRRGLPSRRLSVHERLEWGGRAWSVTIGFDVDGTVREVFVNAERSSGDLEAIIHDGCILLSLLLQVGVPASRLAEHLGREGVLPDAPAASPIGLVAKRLVAIEAELGEQLRDAYRAAGGL
jgi:hypothetical protein